MENKKTPIHEAVQNYYAGISRESSCCDSSCCGDSLYNPDLLAEIPQDVSGFSLGCGDPISLAGLKPGEVVLDLGSGGGLDCFLAAKQVGETGRVIGVDMTPEMLSRARENAERMGFANVEFRHGYLETLPVEDNSIDVVISNCVINLSPDKQQVFREIYRVLKPGGRLAVSDIVTNEPFPEEMRRDIQSWAACVAGAIPAAEYRAGLEKAGLVDVQVTPKGMADSDLPVIPTGPYSALISARKGR